MTLRPALPLLALLLAGCSGHRAFYTPSSVTPLKVEPREPGCQFELLTAAPNRPFVELGVVDMQFGMNPFEKPPTNALEFRRHIAKDVCAAGGDAALARMHATVYIAATVLKYTDAPPAQPQP